MLAGAGISSVAQALKLPHVLLYDPLHLSLKLRVRLLHCVTHDTREGVDTQQMEVHIPCSKFPTAPRRPVSMNGGAIMPGIVTDKFHALALLVHLQLCQSHGAPSPCLCPLLLAADEESVPPAWFDLDFSLTARRDNKGVEEAIAYLGEPTQWLTQSKAYSSLCLWVSLYGPRSPSCASAEVWIGDTETQVQEEITKGIPPERIAIGGFSQGGHVSLKSLFRLKQPLAACIALSTWLEPGLDWEVTRCFFPKGRDSLVS